MKTLTDKLADALRVALPILQAATLQYDDAKAKRDAAAAALAEYEAQREPDRGAPCPHNLTAREWIERARDTLKDWTSENDDTEVLDAFDDICNALDVWSGSTQGDKVNA